MVAPLELDSISHGSKFMGLVLKKILSWEVAEPGFEIRVFQKKLFIRQ
jgi:hypothetical protein